MSVSRVGEKSKWYRNKLARRFGLRVSHPTAQFLLDDIRERACR